MLLSPNNPLNPFKPVQQNRQQPQRAFCPNISSGFLSAGLVLGIVGNFGEGAGTFAHFFARFANGKYDSASHESQQFSHGKLLHILKLCLPCTG